ncbi:Similar to Calcium-independent phospholipase A2-gamma; acc. no. Q8K1N1 [Pyronema omphalodes CBS 100304]|uniref:Similar to Calcium-independent phospholipase A2-gamma acc. no. Q8K1N1 n=1 Tax=Pyronema omphalodes (strain CBS 100304) TaxID=1076935 RepID=U4L0S7_PYROM|nr:Similar to Calcium-independent phospholipase A2-gamma; acc. no. Q8K1N1 [Pyronema omphalodes CBS 100304]
MSTMVTHGLAGLDHTNPLHQLLLSLDQSHCRTVVVAVEIGTVDNRPFLFRSYDHEDPNTTSPTVRNPGRAYNTKIYKVCRATTAAPGYFPSININGATYIDAAFGYNNPSKLAYREVEQMHPTTDGTSPIALLVNIGTGRGTQTGARQPSGSHGTIQRCLSILRSAVRYITNVHDVEEDMRHMAEEHTEGYLQKPEVSQAINEDARTLVRFKGARRNQLAANPTQST